MSVRRISAARSCTFATFLPIACSNVRHSDLVSIYRDDEIFQRLRNPDALMGKCGRCEFREMCGGSRARVSTGNGALVASDPLCAYDPGPDVRAAVPLSRPVAVAAGGR